MSDEEQQEEGGRAEDNGAETAEKREQLAQEGRLQQTEQEEADEAS
jgi:hypothetical protein